MVVRDAGAAHRFALAAAELAANTRCLDVVLLDLRGKSPVTEYFVLATGTSPRQMRTVVDEIKDLGKQSGFSAWRQDGYESAKWIVLDCVNVVVHVFDEESRDFYDLELLWGDAPRIDWRAELGLPPAPPEVAAPLAPTAERGDAWEGSHSVPELESDLEGQEDTPVEIELPDESTGSNSVELIEAQSPLKRGRRDAAFPTEVEEVEDETLEEQAMGPMSLVPEAAGSLDEEVEAVEARGAKRKAAKKGKTIARKTAGVKKAPAKKGVTKKVAKMATKSVGKGVAKKAVKKLAGKAAVKKKTTRKSVVKKKPAKKKR